MRRLLLVAAVPFAVAVAWSAAAPPRSDAQDAPPRPAGPAGPEAGCVECHERLNPLLVKQWRESAHAKAPSAVGCAACHGSAHQTENDARNAQRPTPKVCGECHEKQVKQFSGGKHALAQVSVQAIPMLAGQPPAVRAMGCEACHSVGKAWPDGSVGRCDACHTRHAFSKEEARRPEACETCHMGEDHSQYEMWRSAKHGVIHHLDPTSGRAPACQTCHMQEGDHAVMTGWGFLGLRLPVPDEQWTKDTMTIVQAIGPWGRDEAGMKARVGAIAALKLARLDQPSFAEQRDKMLRVCAKCHSWSFGQQHLETADEVVRETTHLLAESVRVVEGLYADGILPKDPSQPRQLDLLLFYEAPTQIEQELYRMFLFHRQKAFQGAVHANADYMHWFGWAPMKSSAQRIRELAESMRREAAAAKAGGATPGK